jgi:hypothetical protein
MGKLAVPKGIARKSAVALRRINKSAVRAFNDWWEVADAVEALQAKR